jgi:hypothetical protein
VLTAPGMLAGQAVCTLRHVWVLTLALNCRTPMAG